MTGKADRETPFWMQALRFSVLIGVLLAASYRTELLDWLGYADEGWPRWLFGLSGMAAVPLVALSDRRPFFPPYATSRPAKWLFCLVSFGIGVPVLFIAFTDLIDLDAFSLWLPALLLALLVFDVIARHRTEQKSLATPASTNSAPPAPAGNRA